MDPPSASRGGSVGLGLPEFVRSGAVRLIPLSQIVESIVA